MFRQRLLAQQGHAAELAGGSSWPLWPATQQVATATQAGSLSPVNEQHTHLPGMLGRLSALVGMKWERSVGAGYIKRGLGERDLRRWAGRPDQFFVPRGVFWAHGDSTEPTCLFGKV